MLRVMEKAKAKLVKSKSSNKALAKPNQKNKKSSSNTGLQSYMTKKRGVYVKNKPAEAALNNTVIAEETQKNIVKIPKRSSRGSKHFVVSVLNLLSQSSAGAQLPDSAVEIKNKTKTVRNDKMDNETGAMVSKNIPQTEKKKRKYRSKDINALDRVEYLEVIHPRKEIVTTPSVEQSDTSKLDVDDVENIKWSDFLPRLVKPDEDEIKIEKEKKLSHLFKEVNEGRMINDNLVQQADDPKTLVADHKSKTDNGLYNFFVDLLETTFSVYNVNTHYDEAPNKESTMSTNVSFEIDESVAKKLEVFPGRDPPPSPGSPCLTNMEGQSCHSENVFNNLICEASELQPKIVAKQSKQEPQKLAKRKQLRSEFTFPKQKTPAPQSKSATNTQEKKSLKHNNKKNLLNMFKEQLRMDDYSFEEPQNLYQALKVMAKKKKKSQKTIRFDNTAKLYDKEKCTFKSRKVLSLESPKNRSRPKRKDDEIARTSRVMSPKGSEFSHGIRRDIFESSTEDDVSNHSLEVYNIDYNTPVKKSRKKTKEVILTYHSSSDSEQEPKPYDPMVPMMQQIIMTVETICSPDKRISTDFTDNCFTSASFIDKEFETV